MTIKTFFFNPIRVCTYVVSENRENSNDSRRAFIIDCGCYSDDDRRRLYDYIESNHLNITAHLLTHAHLDHVFGVKFVEQQWGVIPMLHTADALLLKHIGTQAMFFGLPFTGDEPDNFLPIYDNEIIDLGFAQAEVIHTPGHTKGGVCFKVWEQGKNNKPMLFTGDTLFEGSIGRTDLPGGNYSELITSIHNQLLTLDDDIEIYPGHGLTSTIGEERRHNAYL